MPAGRIPTRRCRKLQLLSNGRYHVMLTSAGGGSSRWKDLAVTRWRENATCDPWGTFCYLRDLDSGHVWSTTLQPSLQRQDSYEATFATGTATFHRRDCEIETQTDIAVSADDDVELRRVRISNGGNARRVLDVASYTEVVLAAAATDAAHPASSAGGSAVLWPRPMKRIRSVSNVSSLPNGSCMASR